MNKKLIVASCLLLQFCVLKAQTQMQIEFEKFIEKFPKKEWKDLKDIQRLSMDDLHKYPKVSVAEANRNIWYEEPKYGNNNIYNIHCIGYFIIFSNLSSINLL
mgnify:CR=1 FL=1